MTYLNITIFILTFLSVASWLQAKLILSSLGHNQKTKTILVNPKILSLIKTKTGYHLEKIYILTSKKLFGIMAGVIKPHLILSKGLYENFNKDETEYVLLHEMGHFLLKHNLKELILGVILLILGGFTIFLFTLPIAFSLLLGIALGVVMIRYGRVHEYEADNYSLSRMTNPEGMISATNKFQTHHNAPKSHLIEALFYRGNPLANRLKMAKVEISRRQNRN